MLEIQITITELEILERALAIALETGRLPSPEIVGDDTRVNVLRQTLKKARERHEAGRWWGTKKK